MSNPQVLASLARQLGFVDYADTIARPEIKQQLSTNTDRAIKRGIYGVPTSEIGSELFWGADTLPMMNAWLKNQSLFEQGEMARIDLMPTGAMRKESL